MAPLNGSNCLIFVKNINPAHMAADVEQSANNYIRRPNQRVVYVPSW